MEAFHSFWSEPGRCRNGGNIRFPDYEQLTAILSALEWQKHNGPVRMITDPEGAEFFEEIGIYSLWNRIDATLNGVKDSIDPFLFWAAGKLFALKSMPVPCVMLDTDLIVWKNVDALLTADVVAAHPEELNQEVYPDLRTGRLKRAYRFPEDWDFSLPAANTAFLYIRDEEFRDYYVNHAISFIREAEREGLNPVTAMCFAEQRTLPMCAAAKGRRLAYLMDDLWETDEQEFVTHTWGFKQVMEDLPEAREQFCLRCVRRIVKEFPERAAMLEKCRDLKQYYETVREGSGQQEGSIQ